MYRQRREVLADWLIVFGGVGLFGSLFLTWSHQFSAAFLGQWGNSPELQGVPRDPTAWQVYSAADVILALLAALLVGVALIGNRPARLVALAMAAIGLAFAVHALSVPPTNGATIFDPAGNRYAPNSPAPGPGETVAVVSLGVALAGLVLSFTAD